MKKDFYKHIIFDWNGTLLNDSDVSYELTMQDFESCNMKRISREECRKNLNFPILDFFKKYGFDEKKYDYKEVDEKFHEKYMKLLPTLNLFFDVKELLSFLKEHNVSLYVLSVLQQDLLTECVKKNGIYDYFDEIIGLKTLGGGSKVQNAINWFKVNNFNKEDFLMIGDTVHDSEVAKNLDIDCLLVARGDQHKDTLLKTGYKVFDSLKEVLEYFKKEYYNLLH